MINLSPLKIKTVTLAKKILGDEKATALLNYRYITFYKKNQLIFIHIPKAAGTSVASAIYGKRNGHLKASLLKKKMGEKFENSYSFSVSRNPYDRLVSAYKFARQGKTKHGAVSNPGFYQQSVFNSFERFVKEWLVHQNLTEIDLIFQPQHTFIFDNRICLVDDLFKLENIIPLEEKLSKLLNRKISIGKKNQSKPKETNKEISYNEELKTIVYNLYKKDFELLGYSK